jgi:hypothetical protein
MTTLIAGSFLQFIQFIENSIEDLFIKSSDTGVIVSYNDWKLEIKEVENPELLDSIDLDKDEQLTALSNSINNKKDTNKQEICVKKNKKFFLISKATT